jgi:hypothetical protein
MRWTALLVVFWATPGYTDDVAFVPGVGWDGQGADVVITNLDADPRPDMILAAYDNPSGANTFRYRVGMNLDANGVAQSSGPAFITVDGVGWEAQGAGAAVTNLDADSRPDMVLMAYDNPSGANTFRYRVGMNLDANGVAQSWGPTFITVDGVGWEAQGAGAAVTNLDADPRPDMVLMAYDNPSGANTFRYRVGMNLDANGVAQSWGPAFITVDGVGWEGQGAGAAITNLDNDPRPEFILMAYDDPNGPLVTYGFQNDPDFRYRIGWNLDTDGVAASWTPGFTKIDRLGWGAQGAGIAVYNLDGDPRPEMFVMAYDNPAEANDFLYRVLSNRTLSQFPDALFYIKALGGRCLDFGGRTYWAIGAPVYTYRCNGTVAQQVRVKELDIGHDIELRVPNTSLCIGVRGGVATPGAALELQSCNGTPAQRFAVDGDAIMMGMQRAGDVTREYAIEPDQGRTALRTPLVVGTREASDAEYFRFYAVDGTDLTPTTGFVRVTTEAELDSALTLGWGTVAEIATPVLKVDARAAKVVPAGMTIRGYRKLIDNGPEVHTCDTVTEKPLFLVETDSVRITGLRLRGPMDDPRCPRGALPEYTRAIKIKSKNGERVMVDHVEISHWRGDAVNVEGPDTILWGDLGQCELYTPREPLPRRTPVRAIGNFLHHNYDYGVGAHYGASVLIQANTTAYQHAHSFASDAAANSSYQAFDNFVLRKTVSAHTGHDFDVHGGLILGHWNGGAAGDAYDIGFNTILATDELNLLHRGTPCREMRFHDNVLLRSQSESVETRSVFPERHFDFNNHYSSPDPTNDLAVGDFDGDGVDDIFVGTGVAWYFSSGARAEWRFLNRMPEHASELLFGDFDGDGRTDVVAVHNGVIDVSWAGGSRWQSINVTAGRLSDLAVGDFDGDGNDDLFLATGAEWFRAPGGMNWTPFAVSSFHREDLAFGNFTSGDAITDVLGSVGGQYQIVANGGTTWEPIGPARTSTLAGTAVGDFDGDGMSDVARLGIASLTPAWQYSSGARSSWKTLRHTSEPIIDKPIGLFDGDAWSDVMLWAGLYFEYAPTGRNPVQRLSRQNMR